MVCCIYVESEDESCESGITSNITGKKWDKEIVHLLYGQDREKNRTVFLGIGVMKDITKI
jgi:hypothetical protein